MKQWFVYANWTAEVRNASEAVLALRANVTPPPSSSSIFGCVRSGTLGPFPMMCCSLVAQYAAHRTTVREHHVAALPHTDPTPSTPNAPTLWTR